MRDFAISSSLSYQFIMSPLMCKLLAEADFLETDTTYNENMELTCTCLMLLFLTTKS